MLKLIMVGALVVGLCSGAFAASNLYKMRNGAVITQMGQELVNSTNLMCNEFAKLQGHLAAMTQQRDDTTTYDTVATQYGVLDPLTNALSPTHASGMYDELNSMVTNSQAAVLQWCARVRQ